MSLVMADSVTADAVPVTPTWRGILHTWWFVLAVPAGVLLILSSESVEARVAASIYAASLLLVFGTSAAYHRLARSPRARLVMQRLDHSMIYLLIAGTYVPLCLVALPVSWGIPLLCVVAGGALLGFALKLSAFHRVQWLTYALYPVLGWAAIVATPALVRYLTPLQLGLVLAGGIAYTVGFPVLLVQRPNPWPRTFGYHEVWHLFTVVAASLHFAAVATFLV